MVIGTTLGVDGGTNQCVWLRGDCCSGGIVCAITNSIILTASVAIIIQK